MKKILGILIVAGLVGVASADTMSCTSLTINLQRGSESSQALSLQKFLVAKGMLKATPNGYFGPATLSAVKAYQKSIGLAQVGNTGPATRAAIKKESCVATPSANVQAPAPIIVQTSATTTQVQTISPSPTLDSIDLVTLFAGGQTDWSPVLHGSNFSSTSNTVYFKNTLNSRIYTVGTFTSVDSLTITLPKSLTNTVFSCGLGCNEKLQPGLYEITVKTAGGQSNYRNVEVKSLVTSVSNAVANISVLANATSTKVAVLTFSPSDAVILRNVSFVVGSSTISGGGITNTVLKDEITASPLINAGNGMTLSPFQSMIIGAYIDVTNAKTGTVSGYFTVEIEDYIGKQRTKFTSPSFLMTVLGNDY